MEAAPKQDGRNMIMVLAPHRATKAAATAARGSALPRGERESGAPEAAPPAEAAGPAGTTGE